MTKATDPAVLVKQAQGGDEEAMSDIITIHKPLVYTVVYRMLNDPDTSLEITQDVFIKAMTNIKKLKDPEKLKAWLCTITRNLVYDHLRRQKKRPTISLEEADALPGKGGYARQRRTLIIEEALARLSERDRLLLSLAYYEGMSLKEVAEVTKIALMNVKVYLCRARKRLREELRGYEHELMSEYE